MSVLDRKLGRDLSAAGLRLLSIIAVISLGITCFVALISAYWNLEQSRRDYYDECHMADFSIELKKAPRTAARDVQDLPGVALAQPRIVFDALVDLPDALQPVSGRVISLPERGLAVINDVVIMSGGGFTGSRREEVIVDDAFARARGIEVGDWIHLIMNNRRQRLLVVGTGISSEFVYLISPGSLVPEPELFGVFYVKERFAEEAYDYEGACNQIVGLLAPPTRRRPDDLLATAERMLEPYGVFSTTPRRDQVSHRLLSDELSQLRVTAYFLPVVFLSAAALVLNVMMLRLIEQQRTTIGTLKALGYSNADLLRHYLKHAIVVGSLGGLTGALQGWMLAGAWTEMYKGFFEFPRLVNRLYPGIYAAGIAISLLFAGLGVARGASNAIRLNPAEAMRPKPPARGGAIILERWHAAWKRLDLRWQMVLRGVVRARVRTSAGLFAGAAGSALIMVTLAFADAFSYMIDFQFEKLIRSDFDLTLKDERSADALLEAARLPGVDLAEPLLDIPCTFVAGHREKKGSITGVRDGATLTIPRDTDGEPVPVPDAGLLMSSKLAEILRVQVGDEIRIQPITGDRRPRSAPLVRTADSYLGLQAYADFEYLNRLFGEEATVTSVQLMVDPAPEERAAFYRAVRRLPSLESVSPNNDREKNLEEMLIQQLRTTYVLLVSFSGTLFLGSILSAALISLSERAREVATFRVLGYSLGEIGSIFLRESLLVHVVGALLGLPLGYLLLVGLIEEHSTDLFRVPLIVRPSSLILPVAFAVVFTLLAHILVRRSIARMNWLDALNVKE